jgi:serine/threonine protein kinase
LDTYIERLMASEDPERRADAALPCVLGWMIDTMTGLWHLHHSGDHATVHRDLKPPNFLVTRRREPAAPDPHPEHGSVLAPHPCVGSVHSGSHFGSTRQE